MTTSDIQNMTSSRPQELRYRIADVVNDLVKKIPVVHGLSKWACGLFFSRHRVSGAAKASTAETKMPLSTAVPEDPVPQTVSAVKLIRSYEELDAIIARSEEAARISDDERRRILNSFRFEMPIPPKLDPWSEEYRQEVMSIYRQITRKPYDPAVECYTPEIPLHVNRPFPYITQSWQTVGDQLTGMGFVFKAMKLTPGARILDLGPGQGTLTLALAQTGYEVTALDIDANNLEIIRQRAERNSVRITTVCGDFFSVEKMSNEFDAVLFYESFHHCDDHLRLLKSVSAVLSPAGIMTFAGEPIVKDFPYAWGLRGDGESIRAIRYFGWMELGFNEDYFCETLRRLGYSMEYHFCPLTAAGHTYIARRSATAKSMAQIK